MAKKVTNAELAHAFRMAKSILEARDEPFICFALQAAYMGGQISRPVMDKAKKVISDRLDAHGTYSDWMRTHHPVFLRSHIDFTVGRIQWCDALIKEFGGA